MAVLYHCLSTLKFCTGWNLIVGYRASRGLKSSKKGLASEAPLIFPRPGTQIQITLTAFLRSRASGRHGYRTLLLLNRYLVYVFFSTEFTRKSLPAPQK